MNQPVLPPPVRRFGSGKGHQLPILNDQVGDQPVDDPIPEPIESLEPGTETAPPETPQPGSDPLENVPVVSQGTPAVSDAPSGPVASAPAPQAPRLNAAALGAFLSRLTDGGSTPLKTFSVSMHVDAGTYDYLAERAGHRGIPELMRQVLQEVATSPLVSPTHLRNAVKEVALARRPEEKGGRGPAPKASIPVDNPTHNTVNVLARRAGIAPKGVMEAVAFIYVGLAKAAEAQP